MLHQRLIEWESNLPKELQFQMPMTREAMFLVGMLHMAYKYDFCLPFVEIRLTNNDKVTCIFFYTDRSSYSPQGDHDQRAQGGTWHWMPQQEAHAFLRICCQRT